MRDTPGFLNLLRAFIPTMAEHLTQRYHHCQRVSFDQVKHDATMRLSSSLVRFQVPHPVLKRNNRTARHVSPSPWFEGMPGYTARS